MTPARLQATPHQPIDSASEPVALSARLVRSVRDQDGEAADAATDAVAALPEEWLARGLQSDADRIATWVNLYNAATQRLMGQDPAGYLHRASLFRRQALVISGTTLSLDAIEHGLLRRSRWRMGLGWAGNPLPGRFERRFRVSRVDPRIHFALNCAAASCPPISAYLPDRLDVQLDLATRSYLAATVRQEPDRLVVPRLFLWFSGDFGGPTGVRRFLERHDVRVGSGRLRFAPWDWAPAPGAWALDGQGFPAAQEPLAVPDPSEASCGVGPS